MKDLASLDVDEEALLDISVSPHSENDGNKDKITKQYQ